MPLPHHIVVADDTLRGIGEIDAKERIFDPVVFDQPPVAALTRIAGILAIQRITAATDDKATQRHTDGVDAHHIAAAITLQDWTDPRRSASLVCR